MGGSKWEKSGADRQEVKKLAFVWEKSPLLDFLVSSLRYVANFGLNPMTLHIKARQRQTSTVDSYHALTLVPNMGSFPLQPPVFSTGCTSEKGDRREDES